MDYLVTLDIGTTSVKTSLFDSSFTVQAFCIDEYELTAPDQDIIEMNPDQYWQSACHGIQTVIDQSGIDPLHVKVITVVTQGETLIAVDYKGKFLRNAIVWLDNRAVTESNSIKQHFSSEKIYCTTGLPEFTGACPAAKIMWIKNNEPEIFKQTAKFLLLEDYIIMKLTGKFITERTIMSSTGYFDINHDILWEDMINFIGASANQFPTILESGVEAGGILIDVADDIGLNPGTIISTGAMDQVASAIGAGNIEEGIVTETTGTALAIAATTSIPDYTSSTRLTVYKHAVPGKYLILPYCSTAGILLKWFRDEFCQFELNECKVNNCNFYEKMDEMAASVPPLSKGVNVFPHFAGMNTPNSDDSTKGAIIGLGLDTQKSYIIRAIMEAVAYMLKENIDLIEKMGIHASEIRSLGGGAKSGFWCQIKSDVNRKIIKTLNYDESTSLGAALIGGTAIGIFNGFDEACSIIKYNNVYHPDGISSETYQRGYDKYLQLYKSLKSLFDRA